MSSSARAVVVCGVDGLITMNGSGVTTVSASAPVSNQMKMVVWLFVYGVCCSMSSGLLRNCVSQVEAWFMDLCFMLCILFGEIHVNRGQVVGVDAGNKQTST